MVEVRQLGLDGVLEIVPKKFGDARGFFSETYNRDALAAHGVSLAFVQDNHSFSAAAGVLRGLHYQLPPKAQAKLVRVVRGRIYDVAVDIRKGSPSFGKWVSCVLSAEAWNQLLVPVGFAHGFQQRNLAVVVVIDADAEVHLVGACVSVEGFGQAEDRVAWGHFHGGKHRLAHGGRTNP